MKKRLLFIPASLLLLAAFIVPASAITVDLNDANAVLPVDVIVDHEAKEIRKVYDLAPDTDPAALPMDAFERDGISYECTDILREVIIGTQSQTITQTEVKECRKKDMDTILETFPQEQSFTTEDGFNGTLRLVLDSIKSEPVGYGSYSEPITVTRTYPNLSDADTNYLPKTITENGRTLELQDVQWQTDNTYNADDYEIGDRFSAICTYGGTKTVTYATGYTVTAEYTGEVHRTGANVIRYTVIFNEKNNVAEVPDTPPVTETKGEAAAAPADVLGDEVIVRQTNWPVTVGCALAALILGSCLTAALMSRRKDRASDADYEEVSGDDQCCHNPCGRGRDADAGRRV